MCTVRQLTKHQTIDNEGFQQKDRKKAYLSLRSQSLCNWLKSQNISGIAWLYKNITFASRFIPPRRINIGL